MIFNKYFSLLPSNKLALVLLPRLALVLFVSLQILGMLVYPGGTMHDITTVGYTFSSNFFSDLGAYASRNGEPNYFSMIFFAISLTIVGITFSIYYISLPKIFDNDIINHRLSFIGSFFALGGSICLIGTGFTPSDIVLKTHILFANNIFYLFLITALLYTIVIFRSDQIDKKYAIGYGLFFISIFIYVMILEYGPSANDSPSALIFQVLSQKMIVVVFCCSVLHQTYGFEDSKIVL
ncbi:MAG: hypothetical protein ACJZ12_03925 [Candidatus Neomarinimicrobiota bacterium]